MPISCALLTALSSFWSVTTWAQIRSNQDAGCHFQHGIYVICWGINHYKQTIYCVWVSSLAPSWSQGGSCSVSTSGSSSREGSTSKLPRAVDRIHFLGATELIAICFFKGSSGRMFLLCEVSASEKRRPSRQAHVISSGPWSLICFNLVNWLRTLITFVKSFHLLSSPLLEASHRSCSYSRGGNNTKT